ncbi:MAG: methyltransferase domain-containing protein [Solirubrobacterales bacterium]|nr:methyltransferase domain-containing protein [Solirubrobacterales bacterium]
MSVRKLADGPRVLSRLVPSERVREHQEGARFGGMAKPAHLLVGRVLGFWRMNAGSDPAGFKAFEAEGWTRKAATYDRLTGRTTARLVEPLLDAAGVQSGSRLLDVACGPGRCAGAGAARGAVSLGVDAAEGMVAVARARYPEIEFRRADAERLPFADASFDAVVAGFVINHLPRPEGALAEFVRVLRPGGRVAVTVWDRPERMRLLGVLAEAVERTEGVRDPGLPSGGPDAFRFADEAAFAALLSGAGLDAVQVRSIGFEERVADTGELWDGMLAGSVRTAAVIERQSKEVRRRIRAELEDVVAPYRSDDGITLPVSAKLASGRRP